MIFKKTLLLISISSLAGCASYLSIGDDKFECEKKEPNSQCISARKAYHLYSNGHAVQKVPLVDEVIVSEKKNEGNDKSAVLLESRKKVVEKPETVKPSVKSKTHIKHNFVYTNEIDEDFDDEVILEERVQPVRSQVSKKQYVTKRIVKDYVAPNIPNKPIPIRTPAKVMRIWIAPWEDEKGNLNATGYVYTEIEERKWVIGDKPEVTSKILYPLQNQQRKKASATQK